MKKKLIIATIASILALSIWSLVHNDFDFEVTYKDRHTNILETSDEHAGNRIVFDLLENKLD